MANMAIQKFCTVSVLLSKYLVLVLNRLHTFMLRPLQMEENICNVRNMLLRMNNIVSNQTTQGSLPQELTVSSSFWVKNSSVEMDLTICWITEPPESHTKVTWIFDTAGHCSPI